MAQQLFKNNAKGTMSGSLSVGGASITLATGQGDRFPTPSGGDYFLVTLYEKNNASAEINYEVVQCTARVGDTLTIARDFENIVGVGGGRAYPSDVSTNPSQVVYVEMRHTAYAAGNTLTKDDNLASLSNVATARTNLGLGSIATQAASAVAITGGTLAAVALLSTAWLADSVDNTKKVQFGLSGIATATTRTLTVPNASFTLVGEDVTQALTNKTINLTSNTLSGTLAQFNTALSDADFATLAGAETLTNKTINLTSNTLVATSAQLAAAVTDETGSGSLVFATSPTLTTPVLGVASATSINKVAITAPATGATLTLANNSTFATSGAFSVTLTATALTALTLPTTGTLATLAGSETLTNKTVNLSSNTLSGTLAQFNTALSDADFATLAGSETLTNKTLTTPTLTLKQSAAPTPTAEGDIQWDTDGDFIVVGNGAGQAVIPTTTSTHTLTNKTISGASNTITNVSLTSGITGTLALGNGGTGLTTITANYVLGGNAAGTGIEAKQLIQGTNITITHGANSITIASASGSGDVVGPAASVNGEVAIFSGTTGKLLARATGSGLAKLTSGVMSVAVADTDYVTPTGAVTLTNKTLTTPTLTLKQSTAPLPTAEGDIQWDTDGDFIVVGNGVDQTAIPSAASTHTLTNKTINLTSNTLSGTVAQFNAALSDGDFATLAGSETLTNKTLTTPTLTLKQSTAPVPTAEGDIQWDTDGDFIVVGNGAGQTVIPSISSTHTLTNKTISLASNTLTGTSAQLAAAISDETGSGALVFATSPTLTTPVLGVATATSINKVAITAPVTSATLTLADGSTLATAGAYSTTLTATAATNVTLPTTGTLATLAGAETLTNKTIVAANNTITTAASGNLAATNLNAALAELQSDIDTRALDSNTVHKTGAESIAGVKTFTDDPAVLQALASEPMYALNTAELHAAHFKWDAAGIAQIGTSSAHGFRVMTNNAERIRVDSSGNVGVGAAATAGLGVFQVTGVGYASSQWALGDTSANPSGYFQNVSNVTKSVSIEADPNNAAASSIISFKVDGSEKMQISSTAVTIGGAAARVAGKETLWIPAGAMTPRITNGASWGTTELTTGGDVTFKTLDFDTATEEGAQFCVAMPKSWNLGTITAVFYWTAASGSGTVAFGLRAGAITNDDALDSTEVGTGQIGTDTLLLANDLHTSPETSAITVGNTPIADDLTLFEVYRDVATDTLGVDAKLIGVKIFFTTNAANDA